LAAVRKTWSTTTTNGWCFRNASARGLGAGGMWDTGDGGAEGGGKRFIGYLWLGAMAASGPKVLVLQRLIGAVRAVGMGHTRGSALDPSRGQWRRGRPHPPRGGIWAAGI